MALHIFKCGVVSFSKRGKWLIFALTDKLDRKTPTFLYRFICLLSKCFSALFLQIRCLMEFYTDSRITFLLHMLRQHAEARQQVRQCVLQDCTSAVISRRSTLPQWLWSPEPNRFMQSNGSRDIGWCRWRRKRWLHLWRWHKLVSWSLLKHLPANTMRHN